MIEIGLASAEGFAFPLLSPHPTETRALATAPRHRNSPPPSKSRELSHKMAIPSSPQEAIDMFTRVKYAKPMTQWTVCWFVLFVACRAVFFRKYTADFSNRVVSIVHAVAAIYYSYVTFSNGWGGMFDNIGGGNTEPQTLCMAVSLSYFIYDLIYCAVVGEIESVFHHMFTIGGLASGVLNGKSGAELVACLFLMEVSNPSLHLRTLLIEMGLKNSTLFSVNNLIFALVFLVCRQEKGWGKGDDAT